VRQGVARNNSIDKALKILASFAPYNHEMGTVEISRKLGFHKATVSRILLNLARHGFLQQDSHTRKYILGPSIIPLAKAVNQSLKTNMVNIAIPFLDSLRDNLKETVVLETISGRNTVMAYIADGPRLVRLAGDIGDRLPIHAAAGAKAILAHSAPNVKAGLLKTRMISFTPNTITENKILQAQLQDIRDQGFSFDNEEIDEGTRSFGAPIFNHEGRPIAAVAVCGPSQRIAWSNRSGIIGPLKATAEKISAQLHYVAENKKKLVKK
jgi:DNA-binding IclR family transcriptional regulator